MGYAVPMGPMILHAKPGPIPWSAIQTWCDRMRCSAEERDFIVPLVTALDREYIEHWTRQVNRPAAPSIDDKLARWDAAA